MADHGVAQHAQLLHQRARRDDVAQAQRRRQALRDRADVDDAAALVEALQRRHRRAGVQVLGLVVVFDEHEVVQLGLAQQALPALERQRRRGRALVRGRDEYVVEHGQRIDDQAAFVDSQLERARLAQREAVARVRVARLFEAEPCARVEQGFGEQVVGVLRADREDDLLLQREDAALGQQAGADLFDQFGHVFGLEVGCPVRQLRAGQAPGAALAEVLGGKELRVVGAVDEGVRVVAPLAGLGQGGPLGQRAQHARRPVGGAAGMAARLGDRLGRQGVLRPRVAGDEHAAARPRLQEPFVDQLHVGGGDGVAADAEQRRQLARGRQRRAAAEVPFEDGMDDRQAQARLQGQRRLVGQLEQARPLDGSGRRHGAPSLRRAVSPAGLGDSPHLALPRRPGADYAWPARRSP